MATNGNHEHLDKDMEAGNALEKIRTAGSISISPDLFEKLYLQPRDAVGRSGIRQYLGNPTPIGLVGFLLCLTPLSNMLMGWHGANPANNGRADLGAYFFFGGLLMNIAMVLEIIVGNTFPAVVFGSFGAFWLTYGVTLQDNVYMIISGYGTTAEATAQFKNEFAYTLIWMGVLCFIYMIASLRTNVCFFIIFFTLVMAFAFLAGAFFQTFNGRAELAASLTTAGGAFGFVTCVSGWWILASLLLAAVDFPISLPVGDLSAHIPGRKATA